MKTYKEFINENNSKLPDRMYLFLKQRKAYWVIRKNTPNLLIFETHDFNNDNFGDNPWILECHKKTKNNHYELTVILSYTDKISNLINKNYIYKYKGTDNKIKEYENIITDITRHKF